MVLSRFIVNRATFAGFGLSKRCIDRDPEENADQLSFGRSGALGLWRGSRRTVGGDSRGSREYLTFPGRIFESL